MEHSVNSKTAPLFEVIPDNFFHLFHHRTGWCTGNVCADCFQQWEHSFLLE